MGLPEIFSCSSDKLAILGLVAAAYLTLKFVASLWTGLRAYFLPFGVDVRKMGSWAAVTGATDGIGKAYAEELARKGLNIILISRNPEKLSDVAAEIERTHSVKTRCVPIDFSSGPEIYEQMTNATKDLEVGVLVNNVGMSYDYPEFFGSVASDKKIHDVINVNITSVTMTTKVFLPAMTERKRGVIINVASASGARPTPLLAQYSATKAYVDFFSRALQTEYKSKGIIVQSVLPFFVATKLSKIRKTSFMIPGPNTYVKSALGTVGVQDRTFGCISHELQAMITGILPRAMYDGLSLGILKDRRISALKKLEQKRK